MALQPQLLPLPIAQWDYVEKQWYRTGTVSLTQNSRDVVGVGTKWATSLIGNGSFFTADGGQRWYEVESVTDDTHLTLRTPFLEAAVTGGDYAIAYNLMHSNTDMAYRVGWIVDKYGRFNAELINWLSGDPTGGPNGDGKYPITDITGATTLVYSAKTIQQLAEDLLNLVIDPTDPDAIAYLQACRDAQAAAEVAATTATTSVSTIATSVGVAQTAATTATNAATTAQQDALVATGAATSATSANTAAQQASTTAQQAAATATSAANSASSSSTAAALAKTDAAGSAALAAKWAAEAENVPVQGGLYSAYHYMMKARTEATAAAGATAAAAVAEQAKLDAQAAEAAATTASQDAATANTNAQAARNTAVTAANNAATAETLAQAWANTPQNQEVIPGEYSAHHWAQVAMGAATGVAWPADAAGVLTNDGAGNLSWDPAAGGGATLPADAAGVLTNNGTGGLSWVVLPTIAVSVFSTSKTYQIGDLVSNNGAIYRATAVISPGAFNATQWKNIAADYLPAPAAGVLTSTAAGALSWVAPAVRTFSTTTAYVANDVVVYQGRLYRANGAVAPGVWNPVQWTEVGANPLPANAGGYLRNNGSGTLTWQQLDQAAITTFDITKSYAQNDLVAYQGLIYRALNAVAAGAFNATDWAEIGKSPLPANAAGVLVNTGTGTLAWQELIDCGTY